MSARALARIFGSPPWIGPGPSVPYVVDNGLIPTRRHSMANSRVLTVEHLMLAVAYVWAVPIRELNRLYHALHGNGIMRKMYTSGMPVLPKDATTAEQFILWMIDFRGWCQTNGSSAAIVGPLPHNITDDDRKNPQPHRK